jgi:multidrug resistance efflux pump
MFKFFKSHAVLMTIVLIAVIGAALMGGRAFRKEATENSNENLKTVSLISAGSFRGNAKEISAQGTVQSEEQVDLKSQVSSPVVSVNVSLGEWVDAGTTLVNLQSTDVRAQLDQAKAQLSLAMAQYANAGVSLDTAKQGIVDKIKDAYRKVDDAVFTQSDPMFNNPTSQFPRLVFITSDIQLINDIQNARLNLGTTLPAWKTNVDGLNASIDNAALDSSIKTAQNNLDNVANYLDKLSLALTNAISNSPTVTASIPSWKIAISASRGTIGGVVASLTGATQAYEGAKGVISNPDSKNTSPSTGEAQIAAAKAAVSGLEAQLAKTYIRTPVSGRVSNLPVKLGDLVSPGMSVASVTNEYALSVKAYVSDSDLARISYGSKATINGSVSGDVVNISPSVDPNSKKVELKISVWYPAKAGLVVGENVPVKIQTVTSGVTASAAYVLPIQDVKIVQGAAYVYTVDKDSKIVSNDVTLGAIRGDFVEVTSGLTDEMSIVTPVYELEVGEKVNVAE